MIDLYIDSHMSLNVLTTEKKVRINWYKEENPVKFLLDLGGMVFFMLLTIRRICFTMLQKTVIRYKFYSTY